MRINTNLISMNTFSQYTKNNNTISSSVEKLSSGYAINSAADNAAGLAISEKMRAQIRGLDQASTNSQDAISLVQTAEGSLAESTEILQRMRELSVQSANDTNENEIDREALQDEFSQLQKELDDISTNTSFNKKTLLDGSLAKSNAELSKITLGKAGITFEAGNVAAGDYAFSVSTQLISDAVTGSTPTTQAVSTSSTLSVTAADTKTTSTVKSSLMNGNYAISAKYDETGDGSMQIKAVGDNGQTFTATLTKAQLATAFDGANSGAGATNKLSLEFGTAGSKDAFTIALDVTAASYDDTSEVSMESLAKELSKVTTSVSSGTDAKAAEYGVFANLTGAESVKLTAGMTSVTFDNGVKVNFDALKATDVSVSAATDEPYSSVFGEGTAADGKSAESTFTVTKTKGQGLTFQVGANSGDELVINIDKMDSNYLGVASLDISTQGGASKAIKTVDKALNAVSSQRAYLGAIENRLDHKIANLDTSAQNLTSAESQIRDVDMAAEMTKFTNANILSQAATAMLAQANSLPQNVLSLLK